MCGTTLKTKDSLRKHLNRTHGIRMRRNGQSLGQFIWKVPILTTATTEEEQAQPPNLMVTNSAERNAEFWFLIWLLKFNKTSVKKCNLGFYQWQWLVHCSGNSPFIIIFWHTSLCQNAYCQPWTFKEEARNKTAICLSMHFTWQTWNGHLL